MMLVLSRKEGEHILIGRDILITVVKSCGNRVRLGVSAPQSEGVEKQGKASSHQSPKNRLASGVAPPAK